MKGMSLFRQASGINIEMCSICQDTDDLVGNGGGDKASDIRLACGCAFHYPCLVCYIRAELGDKEAVRKTDGIPCPNAISTVGTCKKLGSDDGNIYKLGPEDLDTIVSYAQTHNILLGADSLSHDETKKLRLWLTNRSEKTAFNPPTYPSLSSDAAAEAKLSDLFIEVTSKKCPIQSCPNRESHYHGHHCHHVRDGCRVCKTEFCYKCLSTKEDNIRLRGGKSSCECGFWSSFCSPIVTSEDILEYLVIKPYPYDKRCGCQVCNECRPGEPCGTCDGSCAVCQNYVNPGPLELDSQWNPNPSSSLDSLRSLPHNGGEYVGDIKYGLANGKGKCTWTTGPRKGDKYFGSFKNDKRHGKGTYFWSSQATYIGNWVDDRMEGAGTYTVFGTVEYTGLNKIIIC